MLAWNNSVDELYITEIPGKETQDRWVSLEELGEGKIFSMGLVSRNTLAHGIPWATRSACPSVGSLKGAMKK